MEIFSTLKHVFISLLSVIKKGAEMKNFEHFTACSALCVPPWCSAV